MGKQVFGIPRFTATEDAPSVSGIMVFRHPDPPSRRRDNADPPVGFKTLVVMRGHVPSLQFPTLAGKQLSEKQLAQLRDAIVEVVGDQLPGCTVCEVKLSVGPPLVCTNPGKSGPFGTDHDLTCDYCRQTSLARQFTSHYFAPDLTVIPEWTIKRILQNKPTHIQ